MKITKPNINFSNLFKKIITILTNTLSVAMILIGGLGLFLAYMNPIPWVAGYFPINFAGFYMTGEQAFQEVKIWQATPIQSGLSGGVTILLGLLLHVNNYKNWWKAIKASPRAIANSPMATYRKLKAGRDWLLEKIDYLNSESAKWRRTFKVMKSPYSFLRMMGFSPQMALGLIAVGGTAGTGVVVNETVFC